MNYNIKIDVTKIMKEHLFEGKNGAKWLDLIAWENKAGEDTYGNTHMVVQSLPKEARQDGKKGPILGNAKAFGFQSNQKSRFTQDEKFPDKARPESKDRYSSGDEIPF